MILVDVLTKAIQSSIETIKTFLVGDLSRRDLQDLVQYKVPKSFREFSDYARSGESLRLTVPEEFETKHVIVRQYGLVGWLFNLNMAVIKATDTDASKTLLHTIDNMPNARRPFGRLEMTPQVTTLPSLFGEGGLELHKDFVRIMPNVASVIEKSVLLTKTTIKNWTTDSKYTLILCDADCNHHQAKHDEIHISSTGDCGIYDEDGGWREIGSLGQAPEQAWVNNPEFKKMLLESARKLNIIPKLVEEQEKIFYKLPFRVLQRLAQSIVISLMIDESMIDETLQLIQAIKESQRDPNQKQLYNRLLKKIIQRCLTDNKHLNPQTTLHKAISKANTNDLAELAQNALICSIFSSLAALDNVETLLSVAATIYSNHPETRIALSENIRSRALSFQSDEIDGKVLLQKMQSANMLDLFFKDALRASSFQPRSLPRYLSQSLTCDDVTIPAGTNVFILHRANEKNRGNGDQYAPLFTTSQSAPVIRTTDAAAFSYGNRSCPGNKLTEYVIKSVIAVFVDFMAQENDKLYQPDEHANSETIVKMG